MTEEWIIQMEEQIQLSRQDAIPGRITRVPCAGAGSPIQRIPVHVRVGPDQSLYVPRKISLGPYHHDNPSYREGEKEKERCLANFVARSDVALHEYIDEVSKMPDGLIGMYEGLNWDRWNIEAVTQMMVLDACYILEIMLEATEVQKDENRLKSVFNPNEMDTYKHDMLLFDNQIPFKILDVLYRKLKDAQKPHVASISNIKSSKKPWSSLELLIKRFFFVSTVDSDYPEQIESALHLLHVYRSYIVPRDKKIERLRFRSLINSRFTFLIYLGSMFEALLLVMSRKKLRKRAKKSDFNLAFQIPSATQLEEAQIKIKAHYFFPERHHIYVNYKNKTLWIKPIVVDGATSSNFLNVILSEKLDSDTDMCFSSFVYLMNNLLKIPADSKLLRVRGILNTTLRDEQVIELFNGLGRNLAIPDTPTDRMFFKFDERLPYHPSNRRREKAMDIRIFDLQARLMEGYRKNLEPWRQDLFQKYLRSPCAIISVLAGFMIITLTFIQTVYAVLGYYRKGGHI